MPHAKAVSKARASVAPCNAAFDTMADKLTAGDRVGAYRAADAILAVCGPVDLPPGIPTECAVTLDSADSLARAEQAMLDDQRPSTQARVAKLTDIYGAARAACDAGLGLKP